MRSFLIFIFCIAASVAYPQTNLPSFGKADMKELLLKECSFEKGADAMKLFDIQETEIITTGYDIRIKIERRIRIKIFSKKDSMPRISWFLI